jgi:DNA-nicking Smr family endonuclease
MELDLHGKSHYTVKSLVDQFIYQAMMKGKQEIKIITGNSERMKEVVIGVIKDYDMEYTIGDFWNPGYIRVFL